MTGLKKYTNTAVPPSFADHSFTLFPFAFRFLLMIRTLSLKMAQKLQVINKTTDFAKAVELVAQKIEEPGSDEVRIKQHYAGVNATDINIRGILKIEENA